MNVAVIGLGRLGSAFTDLFASQKGMKVFVHDTEKTRVKRATDEYRNVFPFNFKKPEECSYCILSVPDTQTDKVFTKVRGVSSCEIVIPSGLASIDDYKGSGRVTVIHPVQTFIMMKRPASQFNNIYSVYRSTRGADFAGFFGKLTGRKSIRFPGKVNMPLYHASMVAGSTFHAIIQAMAEDMLIKSGFKRSDLKMLLPLLAAETKNIMEIGALNAVTGPVSRADRDAIRRHSESIEDSSAKKVYELVSTLGLNMLAEKRGGRKK